MAACVQCKVPYVLTGSLSVTTGRCRRSTPMYTKDKRHAGPGEKSTTVICLATTLHSIATGNMTPSYRVLADGTVRPVYFTA